MSKSKELEPVIKQLSTQVGRKYRNHPSLLRWMSTLWRFYLTRQFCKRAHVSTRGFVQEWVRDC